jgi:large subunit ribosomal protein L4e
MSNLNHSSVHGLDGSKLELIKTPDLFSTQIRPDIIHSVVTNLRKNRRQAYAVTPTAGHKTAAVSWGTGRAVARIPRVSGGGTNRCGQGAIGNMCAGGHMYAPTQIWRRWHRKINKRIKTFALASALAASSVPAIVSARGHRIQNAAQIPLIVDDAVESITKTSEALTILEALGASADTKKSTLGCDKSKGHRKYRGKTSHERKGPLVIYAHDNGISLALRNLKGIEHENVGNLSVTKLAPGGHFGRFLIWTRAAVKDVDSVWGSRLKTSFITICKRVNNFDSLHIVRSKKSRTNNQCDVVTQEKTFRTIKDLNKIPAKIFLGYQDKKVGTAKKNITKGCNFYNSLILLNF